MLLTPKDLSFVGYTYKNFEAIKGLHNSFGKGTSFYLSINFSELFHFPLYYTLLLLLLGIYIFLQE